MQFKQLGHDLRDELERIVLLVSDDVRLYKDFISEAWGITATMRDYIDAFYRIECERGQRIERSRYVSIAEDVRSAAVKLRFALLGAKNTIITVNVAILRRCLAQLTDLLSDRYIPERV